MSRTHQNNVGLLMTLFYDVRPRDTAPGPGPRIRLSVLMVLSDDGEMTPVFSSVQLIRCRCHPPGISPHRDKSVSLPRWKYFISRQLNRINRYKDKINKSYRWWSLGKYHFIYIQDDDKRTIFIRII